MATPNYFANATDWAGILAIANNSTGGYFWVVMNMLIWIVAMISLLGFGFETAVLAASFLGLLVALFLSYMGLEVWRWALFYLGAILIMIIYTAFNRKSY
jgi:hypothetical protein